MNHGVTGNQHPLDINFYQLLECQIDKSGQLYQFTENMEIQTKINNYNSNQKPDISSDQTKKADENIAILFSKEKKYQNVKYFFHNKNQSLLYHLNSNVHGAKINFETIFERCYVENFRTFTEITDDMIKPIQDSMPDSGIDFIPFCKQVLFFDSQKCKSKFQTTFFLNDIIFIHKNQHLESENPSPTTFLDWTLEYHKLDLIKTATKDVLFSISFDYSEDISHIANHFINPLYLPLNNNQITELCLRIKIDSNDFLEYTDSYSYHGKNGLRPRIDPVNHLQILKNENLSFTSLFELIYYAVGANPLENESKIYLRCQTYSRSNIDFRQFHFLLKSQPCFFETPAHQFFIIPNDLEFYIYGDLYMEVFDELYLSNGYFFHQLLEIRIPLNRNVFFPNLLFFQENRQFVTKFYSNFPNCSLLKSVQYTNKRQCITEINTIFPFLNSTETRYLFNRFSKNLQTHIFCLNTSLLDLDDTRPILEFSKNFNAAFNSISANIPAQWQILNFLCNFLNNISSAILNYQYYYPHKVNNFILILTNLTRLQNNWVLANFLNRLQTQFSSLNPRMFQNFSILFEKKILNPRCLNYIINNLYQVHKAHCFEYVSSWFSNYLTILQTEKLAISNSLNRIVDTRYSCILSILSQDYSDFMKNNLHSYDEVPINYCNSPHRLVQLILNDDAESIEKEYDLPQDLLIPINKSVHDCCSAELMNLKGQFYPIEIASFYSKANVLSLFLSNLNINEQLANSILDESQVQLEDYPFVEWSSLRLNVLSYTKNLRDLLNKRNPTINNNCTISTVLPVIQNHVSQNSINQNNLTPKVFDVGEIEPCFKFSKNVKFSHDHERLNNQCMEELIAIKNKQNTDLQKPSITQMEVCRKYFDRLKISNYLFANYYFTMVKRADTENKKRKVKKKMDLDKKQLVASLCQEISKLKKNASKLANLQNEFNKQRVEIDQLKAENNELKQQLNQLWFQFHMLTCELAELIKNNKANDIDSQSSKCFDHLEKILEQIGKVTNGKNAAEIMKSDSSLFSKQALSDFIIIKDFANPELSKLIIKEIFELSQDKKHHFSDEMKEISFLFLSKMSSHGYDLLFKLLGFPSIDTVKRYFNGIIIKLSEGFHTVNGIESLIDLIAQIYNASPDHPIKVVLNADSTSLSLIRALDPSMPIRTYLGTLSHHDSLRLAASFGGFILGMSLNEIGEPTESPNKSKDDTYNLDSPDFDIQEIIQKLEAKGEIVEINPGKQPNQQNQVVKKFITLFNLSPLDRMLPSEIIAVVLSTGSMNSNFILLAKYMMCLLKEKGFLIQALFTDGDSAMRRYHLETYQNLEPILNLAYFKPEMLVPLIRWMKYFYAGDLNHCGKNGRSKVFNPVLFSKTTGIFDMNLIARLLNNFGIFLGKATNDNSSSTKLNDQLSIVIFSIANFLVQFAEEQYASGVYTLLYGLPYFIHRERYLSRELRVFLTKIEIQLLISVINSIKSQSDLPTGTQQQRRNGAPFITIADLPSLCRLANSIFFHLYDLLDGPMFATLYKISTELCELKFAQMRQSANLNESKTNIERLFAKHMVSQLIKELNNIPDERNQNARLGTDVFDPDGVQIPTEYIGKDKEIADFLFFLATKWDNVNDTLIYEPFGELNMYESINWLVKMFENIEFELGHTLRAPLYLNPDNPQTAVYKIISADNNKQNQENYKNLTLVIDKILSSDSNSQTKESISNSNSQNQNDSGNNSNTNPSSQNEDHLLLKKYANLSVKKAMSTDIGALAAWLRVTPQLNQEYFDKMDKIFLFLPKNNNLEILPDNCLDLLYFNIYRYAVDIFSETLILLIEKFDVKTIINNCQNKDKHQIEEYVAKFNSECQLFLEKLMQFIPILQYPSHFRNISLVKVFEFLNTDLIKSDNGLEINKYLFQIINFNYSTSIRLQNRLKYELYQYFVQSRLKFILFLHSHHRKSPIPFIVYLSLSVYLKSQKFKDDSMVEKNIIVDFIKIRYGVFYAEDELAGILIVLSEFPFLISSLLDNQLHLIEVSPKINSIENESILQNYNQLKAKILSTINDSPEGIQNKILNLKLIQFKLPYNFISNSFYIGALNNLKENNLPTNDETIVKNEELIIEASTHIYEDDDDDDDDYDYYYDYDESYNENVSETGEIYPKLNPALFQTGTYDELYVELHQIAENSLESIEPIKIFAMRAIYPLVVGTSQRQQPFETISRPLNAKEVRSIPTINSIFLDVSTRFNNDNYLETQFYLNGIVQDYFLQIADLANDFGWQLFNFKFEIELSKRDWIYFLPTCMTILAHYINENHDSPSFQLAMTSASCIGAFLLSRNAFNYFEHFSEEYNEQLSNNELFTKVKKYRQILINAEIPKYFKLLQKMEGTPLYPIIELKKKEILVLKAEEIRKTELNPSLLTFSIGLNMDCDKTIEFLLLNKIFISDLLYEKPKFSNLAATKTFRKEVRYFKPSVTIQSFKQYLLPRGQNPLKTQKSTNSKSSKSKNVQLQCNSRIKMEPPFFAPTISNNSIIPMKKGEIIITPKFQIKANPTKVIDFVGQAANTVRDLSKEPFIGLVNLTGSLCYFNSGIQFLFSIPEMRREVQNLPPTGVNDALKNLFIRMQLCKEPESVNELILHLGWTLKSLDIQSDTSEFLYHFFGYNQNHFGLIYNHYIENRLSQNKKVISTFSNDTPIWEIQRTDSDFFTCFINHCLVETDIADNESGINSMEKIIVIPGKIMIFNIKRNNGEYPFPFSIDFGSNSVKQYFQCDLPLDYTLFSFIIHQSDKNHYLTASMNKDRRWFLINDSSVSYITMNEAVEKSKESSMLLYVQDSCLDHFLTLDTFSPNEIKLRDTHSIQYTYNIPTQKKGNFVIPEPTARGVEPEINYSNFPILNSHQNNSAISNPIPDNQINIEADSYLPQDFIHGFTSNNDKVDVPQFYDTDLDTVENGKISEIVIDAYCKILEFTYQPLKCKCFPVTFYQISQRNSNFNSAPEILNSPNLEQLIFPTVDDGHFFLLVFKINGAILDYYDSIGTNATNLLSILGVIKNYLSHSNLIQFNNFTRVKCAQQNNNIDCGVYMLYFLTCVYMDFKPKSHLTPNEIGLFRELIYSKLSQCVNIKTNQAIESDDDFDSSDVVEIENLNETHSIAKVQTVINLTNQFVKFRNNRTLEFLLKVESPFSIMDAELLCWILEQSGHYMIQISQLINNMLPHHLFSCWLATEKGSVSHRNGLVLSNKISLIYVAINQDSLSNCFTTLKQIVPIEIWSKNEDLDYLILTKADLCPKKSKDEFMHKCRFTSNPDDQYLIKDHYNNALTINDLVSECISNEICPNIVFQRKTITGINNLVILTTEDFFIDNQKSFLMYEQFSPFIIIERLFDSTNQFFQELLEPIWSKMIIFTIEKSAIFCDFRFMQVTDGQMPRHKFSQEEDNMILRLVKEYGQKWGKIAGLLEGNLHSQDSIRKHYYQLGQDDQVFPL